MKGTVYYVNGSVLGESATFKKIVQLPFNQLTQSFAFRFRPPLDQYSVK